MPLCRFSRPDLRPTFDVIEDFLLQSFREHLNHCSHGIPWPYRRYFGRLALLFLLGVAVPGWAQNLTDYVSIHGFGGWGFGRTDGNNYLFGAEDPDYDHAFFSLNISSQLAENVNAVAQLHWLADPLDDLDTDLDYMFVEWALDDALKLRFGRVKQPFGIYAEVFDVGTGAALPQLAAEHLRAAGVHRQILQWHWCDGLHLWGLRPGVLTTIYTSVPLIPLSNSPRL